MKVVVVSSTYPPQSPPCYCGVGDYTARLCAALAGRGIEIAVLTSRGYAGPLRPAAGISVHPLVDRWQLSTLPAIGRFLGRRQATVVNLQYQPEILGRRWSFFNALLALLVARRSRALVSTMHSIANPAFYSPTRLTAIVLARVSRRLVVTNDRHRAELTTLAPSSSARITQIPVGSNLLPDSAVWASRATVRQEMRHELGLAPATLLLAHFGRVYPGKGLELLFAAQARLLAEGYDARLLIIGHVPAEAAAYRAHLATRAAALGLAKQITWVVDAADAAVTRLLLAADVYVVPYADGLTTRRTSAMVGFAHGLPVISTRGPATPAEFVSGEQLLFVPPGDDAALAQALVDLATAPERRAALGEAGHRMAASYSWPVIATRMAEVLSAVMVDE